MPQIETSRQTVCLKASKEKKSSVRIGDADINLLISQKFSFGLTFQRNFIKACFLN